MIEESERVVERFAHGRSMATRDEGKIRRMPNVATVLKIEIARVARKEIKSEMDGLKSASNKYRSDLAALKRKIALLEKQIHRKSRSNDRGDASVSEDAADVSHRFSAKGLASHRKRLGLSADALGKLIGVSGLSIYHWERGKSRPRVRYLPAIAALRTLGKKQAHEVLATRR